MKTKIFILILILSLSTISIAQIIHVPGDEPSIQDGIDVAEDGDTVLVAQGFYEENIFFEGKVITVASHYIIEPNDSTHIYNTIIDGGNPALPNYGSVVYFNSGEDTTSVLCGFTIKNGTGTYPDAWGDRSGGGIFCENSSATIIHNIIIDNIVTNTLSRAYGSGICFATTGDGILIARNNIINNNEINTGTSHNMANGGGIYCYGGTTIIQNNIIKYNYVYGQWARGAGVSIESTTGIVSNNEILYNTADVTFYVGLGAGIFIAHQGPGLKISQNKIMHNICMGTINYKGGGIGVLNWDDCGDLQIDGNKISQNKANDGGGIFLSVSEEPGCLIINNIISDNQAYFYGGGIFGVNSSEDNKHQHPSRRGKKLKKTSDPGKNYELPTIVNNTIVNNTATSGGGIYNKFEENDLEAINNIIYNNEADTGSAVYTEFVSSTTYLNYNDVNTELIYGFWWGSNNIYLDPLFEDPENDDFHLTGDSPCIDAGDPSSEYNADDTEADIGAYYFDQRTIVAFEASEITAMSFQANWEEAEGATSYLLDVAYDENFTDLVVNYSKREVCNASSCIIEGLISSTGYFYRVRANYYLGRSGYSNTVSTSTITSVQYLQKDLNVSLNVFPNPISSITRLSYSIQRKSPVTLDIFDINGKCILLLLNKVQDSGEYEINFDGSDLPAGMYFCVLKTSQLTSTKKIIKL